jgi:hypothetical protein
LRHESRPSASEPLAASTRRRALPSMRCTASSLQEGVRWPQRSLRGACSSPYGASCASPSIAPSMGRRPPNSGPPGGARTPARLATQGLQIYPLGSLRRSIVLTLRLPLRALLLLPLNLRHRHHAHTQAPDGGRPRVRLCCVAHLARRGLRQALRRALRAQARPLHDGRPPPSTRLCPLCGASAARRPCGPLCSRTTRRLMGMLTRSYAERRLSP